MKQVYAIMVMSLLKTLISVYHFIQIIIKIILGEWLTYDINGNVSTAELKV